MPSGVRVRFAIITSCEPSGDRAMIAGGRACRIYNVPPFFVATVNTLHEVAISIVVLAESTRRPAAAEPFQTDYLKLREGSQVGARLLSQASGGRRRPRDDGNAAD